MHSYSYNWISENDLHTFQWNCFIFPRLLMCSRIFMFLIGAANICSQVSATRLIVQYPFSFLNSNKSESGNNIICFTFWAFCSMWQQVSHRRVYFLKYLIKTVNPALQVTRSIFCPVAVIDVYISELMVESNATLEASTLMAFLNTTDFQVTDTNGVSHSVTILQNELVAGMTEIHI